MKTVTMYRTFDGETHTSKQLAIRHLDNLYANKILKLSHRLFNVFSGFVKFTECIDENLDEFLELKKIKDDMQLYDSE